MASVHSYQYDNSVRTLWYRRLVCSLSTASISTMPLYYYRTTIVLPPHYLHTHSAPHTPYYYTSSLVSPPQSTIHTQETQEICRAIVTTCKQISVLMLGLNLCSPNPVEPAVRSCVRFSEEKQVKNNARISLHNFVLYAPLITSLEPCFPSSLDFTSLYHLSIRIQHHHPFSLSSPPLTSMRMSAPKRCDLAPWQQVRHMGLLSRHKGSSATGC